VRTNTSVRGRGRLKRQQRVRARVKGTGERPRLCIFRSNKHIYAQVVDDKKGATLAAVSSLSPDFKTTGGKGGGKKTALAVGELIARRCSEKGISQVVFDRNGFLYRKGGVVATLAEGARKGGLSF
jgi:large subunit ribosomal protein L18